MCKTCDILRIFFIVSCNRLYYKNVVVWSAYSQLTVCFLFSSCVDNVIVDDRICKYYFLTSSKHHYPFWQRILKITDGWWWFIQFTLGIMWMKQQENKKYFHPKSFWVSWTLENTVLISQCILGLVLDISYFVDLCAVIQERYYCTMCMQEKNHFTAICTQIKPVLRKTIIIWYSCLFWIILENMSW